MPIDLSTPVGRRAVEALGATPAEGWDWRGTIASVSNPEKALQAALAVLTSDVCPGCCAGVPEAHMDTHLAYLARHGIICPICDNGKVAPALAVVTDVEVETDYEAEHRREVIEEVKGWLREAPSNMTWHGSGSLVTFIEGKERERHAQG
jgi:hypothetical protein